MSDDLCTNIGKRYERLSAVFRKQQLITVILKLFPNSRVLSPTEVKQLYIRYPELSAPLVSRRETRRADVQVKAKGQYQLFDDFKGGGI